MKSGKITISRPARGDGKEVIYIRIEDDASRARFLEIEIGYREFAECLTGLSSVPIEFETRALDVVGMKRETINASLTISLEEYAEKTGGSSCYDKDAASKLLERPEYQLIGWSNSTYLGSQNSIVRKGDDITLNFSRYRFIPSENVKDTE